MYVVGYVQAKRELASVREGVALRIGRAGVQVADAFAYWPQVSSLHVVKGRVGRSPRLAPRPRRRLGEVPLDQLDVLPATLDTTARAYSAGRHGVDLRGPRRVRHLLASTADQAVTTTQDYRLL